MKVKIKGLVFVGFAAAVFAQSAMATISANTADKKIVASKYYVDTTFQEEEDKVTTGNIETIAGEGDPWASATLYPSMQVVKSAIDDIDVNVAANSNASGYLNVTKSQDGGEFTLNLDNAPATAAAELTGTLTNGVGATLSGAAAQKLVTTGAVNALIDGEATAGATTIDSDSTNGTVPTSKNVYDFVTGQVSGAAYQPKVTDTGDNLKVGYLGSGTGATPTWKTIKGASTGTGSTTDYVTINQDGTSGVYEVNLDTAQIADSIASDASQKLVTENAVYDLVAREGTGAVTTINGTNPSDSLVPTVKNVYDFVDGNYQAKATATGATVQTGYNGTWHTLSGDSTYITVADDGNAASVTLGNLTAHGVAGGGGTTGVDPYDSDFVTGGTKLARSGDVYDFVMDQMGGLALPPMSQECRQAAAAAGGGHYCALVYGDTDGQGTLGLQWTIMAPEPEVP